MRLGVVLLVAVTALLCAATAAGESRQLAPVVRDLEVRVVDPVASVRALPRDRGIDVRLPGDVLFAFDEARLGTPGRRAVAIAARILGRRHASRLVVEGHTDARGSAAYNLRLAGRRAATVAGALGDRLPDARIAVRSYGEARPVASNATAEGRARNRRVEIRALRASR